MDTKGQRLVLDTNVFITIFSKRGENRWIYDEIIAGNLLLCISNDIFFEYWEVLDRKTNPLVALNIVEFLVVHPHILRFSPYVKWNHVGSDPDDNKFVDCYLQSGAVYLTSNDRHLVTLKALDFPKLNVLTTIEFKQAYDQRNS